MYSVDFCRIPSMVHARRALISGSVSFTLGKKIRSHASSMNISITLHQERDESITLKSRVVITTDMGENRSPFNFVRRRKVFNDMFIHLWVLVCVIINAQMGKS